MSTSIHPSGGRPLGPRPNRAPSPLPPTAPLTIRKHKPDSTPASSSPLQNSDPPPSAPEPRRAVPKLGLVLPGAPSPAPSGSKPKLSLALGGGAPAPRAVEPDSPSATGYGLFSGGYYGGPSLAPPANATNGGGSTTIRPGDPTINASRGPRAYSMDDLSRTIHDIETRGSAAATPDPTSTTGSDKTRPESGEYVIEPYPYTEWNDDVFEDTPRGEDTRLGEGAGGAVSQVVDKRTGVIMARKTIQTREAPMKQLLRELNLITTISHPNIIRFYGAYMSPSSSEVKVVMELCEGKSLEAVGRRIRERGARVGEKVAGRLAEGILQGLAYLRSKDLIHRDIKPSNILLARDGVVKLCDFGVSGELIGSVVDTFTGTSLYMAPERLQGLEYSIRADVWSTGLSLLELVQNRFPFSADLAPIELMIHISSSEPPQLEDEDGFTWSDAMKDFIRETLRVDPAERPTPKDLLNHPWIRSNMSSHVNMARWLSEVWGWKYVKPEKTRRSGHTSTSRPGTSSSTGPAPAIEVSGP
ncbi:unnamed protein product [Peniophora sp. CBMAI 1063]|nr:unnamed protein product [Peniophora sp. CBMAI 1063]